MPPTPSPSPPGRRSVGTHVFGPASVPPFSAVSVPVPTVSARPPSPSFPAPVIGRTRHRLALRLVAASVVPVVLGGASSAPVSAAPSITPVAKPNPGAADQPPDCGDPDASSFPISTRIHGGPDAYVSGGGYGIWYLDLTNTTDEPCRAIHPVLVLTDEERKLTSDQIQLEFSEPARLDVVHRVSWETTDQDEHIGVFVGDGADDPFDGFTVPAGRTLTVPVRMAFTSDTGPGRITVSAAIVQRQRVKSDGAGAGEDDGAWVGESADYLFSVVEEDRNDESADIGETEDARPTAPAPGPPELAATGPAAVPTAAVTVAGFLIGGGAMVIRARRMRRPRL
ncbi:hypothetical protein AB0L71_23020 [Streptomyces sp. NPDC052052]|uniref:hypothetical protein n=1 Tax=Streptomyces sp. NPDC052052 TaxID=3154756 RepID=UPI003415573B